MNKLENNNNTSKPTNGVTGSGNSGTGTAGSTVNTVLNTMAGITPAEIATRRLALSKISEYVCV